MQQLLANRSFAAAGVVSVANASFGAAEQLAGHQSCQACKEKNQRRSLKRGKLGKDLAIPLLIPLMGWAMLVFVVVLLLLSRSCTMSALVLCNVLLD